MSRRRRRPGAAKSTSGPVGVEVRLSQGLWECTFSKLGRQAAHPKRQSYVKANPELEKKELNSLLLSRGWAGGGAGRSQFSYYPRR